MLFRSFSALVHVVERTDLAEPSIWCPKAYIIEEVMAVSAGFSRVPRCQCHSKTMKALINEESKHSPLVANV